MKQVARNLTDMWDGFLLGKRYLIHDRDPLFTEEVRGLLRGSGVKPVVSKNTNELKIGTPGRFGIDVYTLSWPMGARILAHEDADPALDTVGGCRRWLAPA